MNLQGNKILITGGTSGIGRALAMRFISEGNTVIVCGRRQEMLENLKAEFPELIIKACDLSIPEQRIALFKWVSEEHSDLSVLVNNAGIQQWMSVSDDDFYQRAEEELAINVLAPLQLVHLFLKLKNLKTIMNVTSGLSFVPLVKVPVYCGTKAFFHSFTLSLRELMKSRNIEVVEIIPPALNTDLGGKGLHDFSPPVSDFIHSIFEQLGKGKTTLTFGFSDAMLHAGPEEQKAAFHRMNPQVI